MRMSAVPGLFPPALVALLSMSPLAAAASPQRKAVVRVEVVLDLFSFGPELVSELAARQPWTPYEAEISRRLRVGSMGTGFFVNPRGDLVTNAHVLLSGVRYRALPFTQSQWDSLTRLLTGVREAWVAVGEGDQARSYPATLVAVAEDLDLAVLRVRQPPGEKAEFVHLTLGSSQALRAGQSITALGFPADEFQASGGEILSLIHGAHVHEEMRLVRRTSPDTGETAVTVSGTSAGPVVRFQHSAPTGHGSSGGPVLDSQGRVIGVAYALLADRSLPGNRREENDLNLAVTSGVLKRFLADHAVPFTEAGQ